MSAADERPARSAPIGVYDSGFGGLTVLRALRETLPHHDFVYLGDAGRAPYGGRDVDTILDFSEQCVERLFEEGCRLVVVACHTVSCVALRHLQLRYAPPTGSRRVLGVTIPAAEAATAQSRGHIGVIATARTVASHTWITEIGKLGPHRVTQLAAPLLAPLVEEGWEDTDLARLAVERYLGRLPGSDPVDTLVLGCTHYPLLLPAFRDVCGAEVDVLDPSRHIAARLADWLARHPEHDQPGHGGLRVLCTGDPGSFADHGRRFLGEELPAVEHVGESRGRLAPREVVGPPRGQIVRARTVG